MLLMSCLDLVILSTVFALAWHTSYVVIFHNRSWHTFCVMLFHNMVLECYLFSFYHGVSPCLFGSLTAEVLGRKIVRNYFESIPLATPYNYVSSTLMLRDLHTHGKRGKQTLAMTMIQHPLLVNIKLNI